MRRAALFSIIAIVLAVSLANAAELLKNGGFERPITDKLSRQFKLNQQDILGWKFSGSEVRLINHTRLLPAEGFQCLLLPGESNKTPALRQTFEMESNGLVQVSFRLAASKAVDGEAEITLDGKRIKLIQLSKFWKPEETALTDNVRWKRIKLPPVQLTAGSHTLGFHVLRFEPRVDRQGDKRWGVQGILMDGVSVKTAPFNNAASVNERSWPEQTKSAWPAQGPLPLDCLAGPWMDTRTLACYPSIANFYGALRSTKQLGGIQYLGFADVGSAAGVLNAVALNGEPVLCDQSRWYPYQLCTRAHSGPLDLWSVTRMVFANHGVLNVFAVTNPSDKSVERVLAINLGSTHSITQPDPNTVVVSGTPTRAYSFTPPPDRVITTNGNTTAEWTVTLAPHDGKQISLVMAMEKTSATALKNARQWGGNASASFAAAKTDWEKRWNTVFTPDNRFYSGCLPTLETDDDALRKLYYLSIASLLETERDNFTLFKPCFVGSAPEWGSNLSWFWDYSLTSLPYALLNPAVMKAELRHWLTINWRSCSHYSQENGKPEGMWYAVNPYAYFLSLDLYLTVTGDFEFLTNKVNGKTVLEYMKELALDWKRLVPKNRTLADIGGNCWNMLEAPPNYIHTVASINAEDVWMMRRLAEYETRFGNPNEAAQLRAEAGAVMPKLLKLYNPKTGSWNVLFPDGRIIDSRHIYDYLTVGTTISQDLSPRIKTGMINFADRELMTRTWMRAMSRQDPSALDSDRSDHGPSGSYSGWPAKAAQATAEMGHFDLALEMFHRFQKAFRSAIPQAVELRKIPGQKGWQARVSNRAGASFAEVSGSYADVIINTFFGFRPGVDGSAALWKPDAPRGFKGRLRHVRWANNLYTITSGTNGLTLEKE